ncbi:sulfatase [Nocardioides sp.]|uniref:sulfatase family protein n=1 Tax=Nocardioides sp. TaxID=35761 RepID=UPI002ED57819
MRRSTRAATAVLAVLPLLAVGMAGGATPAPNGSDAPSVSTTSARAPDPRPNIVAITADDMRVSDLEAMPRLRRLLRQRGTTFARSYATFPLCCPSRASFLTGQYAHNHGVLDNEQPLGGYAAFDPSSTVATWLDDAGYQTAFVGKFINEYGAVTPVTVPPGWDDFHASIGGGHYFETTLFENGAPTTYDGPYQTDVYGRVASDLIEERVARRAPLFLWASFYAPHVGRPREPDDPGINTPAVAPRHRDRFADRPLRSPRSFDEPDVSDKPRHVRQRPRLSADLQAQMRESYQQRLESLLALDAAVGRIVATLRRSGELPNTVVLFTADNGWMMGEHRIHAGKTVVYEPSTRVPLIVRGPGFPAGTKRHQLVANIDVAPTFAALARTRPGLRVDGRSLLPLARRPSVGRDRRLVLEAGPRSRNAPMFYTAVRTDRWLYVEYGETGERELYDMDRDPHQLVNQARNPAYREHRQRLARRLAELRDCAGRGCR